MSVDAISRRTLMHGSFAANAMMAAQPQPASRPNILWICTDQQRWDTIASLGQQEIRTPNLDSLAAGGVAFTHAYCQNPICTPSRASFLTGCYPGTIHVHRNGNSHFPTELAPRIAPRILAKAGYDCGLIGKLHLSAAHNRVESRSDDGYRVFEWSHHPKPEPFWPVDAHAYQRWLRDRGIEWSEVYRTKRRQNWPPAYQPGMPERYHEITWAAERARALINGGLKGPWFLSVNIFAPHPPFDPAPEYLDRIDDSKLSLPLFRDSDLHTHGRLSRVDHQTAKPSAMAPAAARAMKAAYYAMIEHIDHEVGRIVEALDTSGQGRNTVVVFASDHGEMLGDHGLRAKGCRFYEGAVRVPLILSWPSKFQQGILSPALVELTDILPTLLEAAGMEVPAHIQGRSLMGLLTGRATAHRDFVRSEYHGTLELPDGTHATMIRTNNHKLVRYHGHGYGELYDLRSDPDEFVNLWDGRNDLRCRLTEQLYDAAMLATDPGQQRVGRF